MDTGELTVIHSREDGVKIEYLNSIFNYETIYLTRQQALNLVDIIVEKLNEGE